MHTRKFFTGGSRERQSACQHFIKDNTQRVNIRSRGGSLTRGLLRREILRRTPNDIRTFVRLNGGEGAGDAKVRYLEPSVRRDDHIVWLDITMHQSGAV